MRVLTIGTFDIPHAGHAAFLRKCAQFGQLTVGVNSDDFVRDYKGEVPLYSQAERMTLIEGMGYDVALNDGPGIDLIDIVEPDLLAIGSDWLTKDYLAQIDCDEAPCSIVFIPYTAGISTSDIKRRLSQR